MQKVTLFKFRFAQLKVYGFISLWVYEFMGL